jgi:predicted MFS family arabinose efflux permease
VLGVLLGGSGLVLLVDACSQTVTQGLTATPVLARFGLGLGLLVLFVVWQAHGKDPLLPLRIVLDRNRGGAYLCVALAIVGLFGAFLFLTYELQAVLGYRPLQAGLAFLPLSGMAMASSGLLASRLLPYVPARALMAPGFLVAAAGMAILTQLQVSTGYVNGILPAELLLGLGIGCVMVPASSLATAGVDPREAGVASATLNTAQQVGASVGTALLNTLATSATGAYLASQPRGLVAVSQGLVHGYAVAAAWGTAILVLGAVLAMVMISAGRPTAPGARQVGAPRASARG